MTGKLRVMNYHRLSTKSPQVIRIDRGSLYGNFFKMKDDSDEERNRVCDLYEKQLQQDLIRNPKGNKWVILFRLIDKTIKEQGQCSLGCWCYPKRCHGDAIIKAYYEWKGINNDCQETV